MAKRTCIYHPNAKGTGMALAIELHPATEVQQGYLVIDFVRQSAVAKRENATPTFPRFDWAERRTVRLSASEVAMVLGVFAGVAEAINGGKGIEVANGSATLKMRHRIEPTPWYVLSLAVRDGANGKIDKREIALSPTEATMLYYGLTAAMERLLFGD